MAYPTNKAALLRMIGEQHDRLETTIAAMSAAELTAPSLDGGWSAKDALAHLAFWEQNMLSRIRRAAAGERIERSHLTDEQRAAEVDRINAEAYLARREQPLAEVLAEFHRSYQEVRSYFDSLSEEQIFGSDAISAQLGYPVIELMAGDTYDHYSEHADAIQATHTQ